MCIWLDDGSGKTSFVDVSDIESVTDPKFQKQPLEYYTLDLFVCGGNLSRETAVIRKGSD